MYTHTLEHRNLVKNDAQILVDITATLADTSVIHIRESNIIERSLYIDRVSSNYGALPIGAFATNELGLTLDNRSGTYTNVTFKGASLAVEFQLMIGGVRTKLCDGGIYYIIDAPNRRKFIQITAYDCTVKTDIPNARAGEVGWDFTLRSILAHCASACFGDSSAIIIPSDFNTLANQELLSYKYPSGSDVTHRNTVAWVATLLGCLARAHGNTDSVQLARAEDTGIRVDSSWMYEENFSYNETVELTGIKATDSSGNEYSAGTSTYALGIDSNGIFDMAFEQDSEVDSRQSLITNLWASLSGYEYTPCHMRCLPMPWFECGDMIEFVDDYGTAHTAVLTHIRFVLGGETILEATADSAEVHNLNASQASPILRSSLESDMLRKDAIKSDNYSYTSGDFSESGTFLNLVNGALISKNICIKANGEVKIRGSSEQIVVKNDASQTALGEIANGTEYRYIVAIASLSLTIPAISATNSVFASTVVMTPSVDFLPTVTNNSGYTLKYCGDGVQNGVFTAVANTRYRLSFVFDGQYMICYISGTAI